MTTTASHAFGHHDLRMPRRAARHDLLAPVDDVPLQAEKADSNQHHPHRLPEPAILVARPLRGPRIRTAVASVRPMRPMSLGRQGPASRPGLAVRLAVRHSLAGCATPPGPVPQVDVKAVAAPAGRRRPLAKVDSRAYGAAPARAAGRRPALPVRARPAAPSVIIDANDASVRTDLWVRVRSGFAMPDLDNALVIKWQQWYASRPDYVQRMTERGGRYLFYVVEEIEKRGMPTELALLPFIESAFNPAGHVGGTRLGHVAVHARHRQGLRPEAEPVPRRPARRARVHARGTRLPADAAAPVRRLAARAGCLQLGAGQRAAGRGPQPQGRAAAELRKPAHARRDAQLRAQAAGGEEHRDGAAGLLDHPAAAGEPPVLPDGADHQRHRRRCGGSPGRHLARRVPAAESADEQAGDPGGRHAPGAAALQQCDPVRAQSAGAPRSAGHLDGLGVAGDAEAGRRGPAGGHERDRTCVR